LAISPVLDDRPFVPTRGPKGEDSLHFIKYMGSKRNILDFVAPVIREVTPEGGLLLDLMAGSHAVGYAVKRHCAVWGNDIQSYCEPLGRTLLLTDPGSYDVDLVVSDVVERTARVAEGRLEDVTARSAAPLLLRPNVHGLRFREAPPGIAIHDDLHG
jgi:hypothetical protein